MAAAQAPRATAWVPPTCWNPAKGGLAALGAGASRRSGWSVVHRRLPHRRQRLRRLGRTASDLGAPRGGDASGSRTGWASGAFGSPRLLPRCPRPVTAPGRRRGSVPPRTGEGPPEHTGARCLPKAGGAGRWPRPRPTKALRAAAAADKAVAGAHQCLSLPLHSNLREGWVGAPLALADLALCPR